MPSPLFFRLTATLQRPAVTKDASGGMVQAFAAVPGQADLPVSVQPLSAHVVSLYAARQVSVSHAVYFEADPGYRRGDRLLVSDGRAFSLGGMLDQAGAGRVFKVLAQELLA